MKGTALTLVLLFTVLAAGAAVRVAGISHGEPRWIWHPDVSKQAVVARAVYNGAADPYPFPADDIKRRLYPYGTAVLLGKSLRWAEGAGLLTLREGDFPENDRWLWSRRLRFFAAAVYLAAAALVLAALYPLLGPAAALLAGLLLVLEPLVARFSHYGMNDVPLAGILLLSWVCCALMAGGGWRAAFFASLGGLLMGAGFAVKYQALIALIFPLVAWLLLLRKRRFGDLGASVLLFAAAFCLAAAFASPLFSRNPLLFAVQFRQFMGWQANILEGQDTGGFRALRNSLWLLRFLAVSWLWVFLPGLVLAGRQILREKEETAARTLLLSALVFTVALPLVLILSRDLMRGSDLIIAVPFLVLISALAVQRGGPGGRGVMRFAGGGAILMIMVFGVISARDSASFAREDTRLRARRWCREEIPTGSSLVRDSYILPVALDGVEETKKRFLVDRKAVKRIAGGRYDYVISSSLAHDRFLDPLSPFSTAETRDLHRSMTDSLTPLAVFEDRHLPFNNPTVTVYRYGVSP